MAITQLSGCTEDNNDLTSAAPFRDCVITEGVFVDSVVEGLGYGTGATDSDGVYLMGCGALSFSIGDIQLGQFYKDLSGPLPVISPLNFTEDTLSINNRKVQNITRFLQTLDSDKNQKNGIFISQSITDSAVGISIDFDQSIEDFSIDPTVLSFLETINQFIKGDNLELVDSDVAMAHLEKSLSATFSDDDAPGLYLIRRRFGGDEVQFKFDLIDIKEDGTVSIINEFTRRDTIDDTVLSLSEPFLSWEIIDGEIIISDVYKYSLITISDTNKKLVRYTSEQSFFDYRLDVFYKLNSDELEEINSTNLTGSFIIDDFSCCNDKITFSFNNDNTGTLLQTDKSLKPFTWYIDINNSVIISIAEQSQFLEDIKLTLISGNIESGEFLAEYLIESDPWRFKVVKFIKE